jgi:hypothetical protein
MKIENVFDNCGYYSLYLNNFSSESQKYANKNRVFSHSCATLGGFGGSVGVVVAQLGLWWLCWGLRWLSWGCGGSVGVVVAHLGLLWLSWGCGGSVRGCGGSVGGCGGSVGVVVTQLGLWWLRWGCGGSVD